MRILLDQAVHDHRNKGNNALLEVAMNRLRRFWPEAQFDVLSISPHFCHTYLPGTRPVFPHNLELAASKLDTIRRFVPQPMWRSLFELRELLHAQTGIALTPGVLSSVKLPLHRQAQSAVHQGSGEIVHEGSLQEATAEIQGAQAVNPRLCEYDLYLATGGGYMCDTDKRFLMPLLDRMKAAVEQGIPAVMVGQGVGPIDDVELIDKAKEVLPLLDYILIREEQIARPLLESFGVSNSRVMMTGDDAIELGYQIRCTKQGQGIGLSLRTAQHTAVNTKHIEAIRPVVLQAAQKYRATLIAAPISYYQHEADLDPISKIMSGHDKRSASWRKFEVLPDFIRRIGHCRVMISGTLHGAVFALSQGIPVITLAKSTEYFYKLSGLAVEFGKEGCQVIHLNDEQLTQKLADALDFAYSAAEELRPILLAHSARQIELGYHAYQHIFDLVEQRRRQSSSRHLHN